MLQLTAVNSKEVKNILGSRYVSGKRPDYAQESSDEEDEPVFYNEPAPGTVLTTAPGRELITDQVQYL